MASNTQPGEYPLAVGRVLRTATGSWKGLRLQSPLTVPGAKREHHHRQCQGSPGKWTVEPQRGHGKSERRRLLPSQHSRQDQRIAFSPGSLEHCRPQESQHTRDPNTRQVTSIKSRELSSVELQANLECKITVLELFVGMASGLEMVLRNGLSVDTYIYCDKSKE